MYSKMAFQDKKYLHKVVESWTINRVDYEPDDLLIFIDETGNPKLNGHHSVFGVGGCASLGRDYQSFVKPEWQSIKDKVFNLSSRETFHASYHLRQASDQQVGEVAQFLIDPRIKKFSAIIDRCSHVNNFGHSRGLDDVVSIIQSSINELISDPFALDHWIYEHSDSISRLCIENIYEGRRARFNVRGTGGSSVGLRFMKSKMAEPGLEISDLIMYLVGLHSREAPTYRGIYDKILGAAFDNRAVGLSTRLGPMPETVWLAPKLAWKIHEGWRA